MFNHSRGRAGSVELARRANAAEVAPPSTLFTLPVQRFPDNGRFMVERRGAS
jgi:hypothetical protein